MPKEVIIPKYKRFGRLTFISSFNKKVGITKIKSKTFCKCICDCGKKTTVEKSNLTGGKNTKSCGCLFTDSHYTHRLSKSKIYKIWCAIVQRCTKPNDKSYKNYGGRGIACDPTWVECFENFFRDVGEIPKGLTIERKNNNLGYFKENIIFATRKQQSNNTRTTVIITWKNRTQSLSYWSEELGIRKATLYSRIFVRHWNIDDAFTIPVKLGQKYEIAKQRRNNAKKNQSQKTITEITKDN